MNDLKQKTIRGGLVRICAQAANFALRIGSLMVLARLLNPADFGLVGMVTAFDPCWLFSVTLGCLPRQFNVQQLRKNRSQRCSGSIWLLVRSSVS